MNGIVDGFVCLFLVSPGIIFTFCYVPRYLVLREISRMLHIRNPKVKWTSFDSWVMLTYYRSKAKRKGICLRTYPLYLCSIILSIINAILVVIGSFGNLRIYEVFQHMVKMAYLALCAVNIVCFYLLRFKYKV